MKLDLREATLADVKVVHRLANDPHARAMSFSTEPIAWEEHVRWFEAKLSDSACRLYLLVGEDHQVVGQIRFDVAGDAATISIVIAPALRGRGLAPGAIRLGVDTLFATSSVRAVTAYIKPVNEASRRAFARAGFSAPVQIERAGEPVLRMRAERPGS